MAAMEAPPVAVISMEVTEVAQVRTIAIWVEALEAATVVVLLLNTMVVNLEGEAAHLSCLAQWCSSQSREATHSVMAMSRCGF